MQALKVPYSIDYIYIFSAAMAIKYLSPFYGY